MAPAQQVKWNGGYNIEIPFNISLLRASSKEEKIKWVDEVLSLDLGISAGIVFLLSALLT